MNKDRRITREELKTAIHEAYISIKDNKGGRNADYILKDREDVLHVYIHADMDYRADRIVRLYGESEKSPEARLKEKDKRRSVNYQHYTGRTWGASENYDLCINTAVVGEDKAAELILSLMGE